MRPVLCLAFAAILVAGCDSSTPEPVPASQSDGSEGVVPLAVGNTWVFRSTFTQLSSPGQPTTESPVADTLRVVELRVQGGETWYRLASNQTSTGGSVLGRAFGGWLTNRADGLYQREYADTTRAMRIVKFPVSTGEVYGIVPPFIVSDTTGWHFESRVTVKRTDHPVTVAGRTVTGPMYTRTLERLWISGTDYPFAPETLPLREVYGEGVGYGYLEAGYASTRTGTAATLDGLFRFTLVDATIAD